MGVFGVSSVTSGYGGACPWWGTGATWWQVSVREEILQRICRYFAGRNQATGVWCPYAYDPLLRGEGPTALRRRSRGEQAVILVVRDMARLASSETLNTAIT